MAKTAVAERGGDDGLVTKVKGWPERTKTFLSDVRNELRKVNTPSRKEVQATTTVVIITVFIFGAYFFVIDRVLGYGIERLFQYFR